ncbi:MAG: ferric reductase-like transmembrane domain-containing protein, partial [Phycisphaerae bacterium]|nr:ferric reductase-like transmembrane domain-containing protein [Phycisphaerae bacterium]
ILITLIIITTAIPMLFVRFDEPSVNLQLFKFFAKMGAICGSILLGWQYLLSFRAITGKFLCDLIWVLKLHKTIGKYVLVLITLHPIFITIYYLGKKNINPLLLQGDWPFQVYVLLGELAFLLMILIVITSIFFRARISMSTWFGIHLTSYIALPLIFVHSLPIGMTLNETALYNFWVLLAILLALLFIFRLLYRLELFSTKYLVKSVEVVGPAVTKITASPVSAKIKPHPGQFIYFRWGLLRPARPFTVSHYNSQTHELSITVKASGKITTLLQSIKPGEKVYIDGPYGVFCHAAIQSNRPLVMIAGGIGITPFIRLFEELAYEPDRQLHLFYGNKNQSEIVYKQELDNIEQINIIHVMSQDTNYPGETGYITTSLLKKHLSHSLNEYEFLICGPPVMTKKLEEKLIIENIPSSQIHHELFSY